MLLLLHICCAPCSVACVKVLREEGVEPAGFWYNPNIHPFLEYKARRDTLRQYAGDIGLELREEDFYGLRAFTAAVAGDSVKAHEKGCQMCLGTAPTAAAGAMPAAWSAPPNTLRTTGSGGFPPRSWCPPTRTGS